MKILKLICVAMGIAAMGLSASPVSAAPLAPGADAALPVDAPAAGRAEGFQGLVTPVNIVGHDDRNSVDHFHGHVSRSEGRWLAEVTGWVECQATASFPGTLGSASLVGSTSKIVTAAHNFYDEQRRLPSPLPHCYFRTKAHPGRRIPLVFEPGHYRIGATFWDASRDYAIVSLAQPVRGVVPLQFAAPPAEGNEVILISAEASFARRRIDTSKPVARVCTVHKTFSPLGSANSFFRGDCDTSAGDSGGIYLMRRSGRLVAVGLHHGGGLAQANGLTYDDSTWDNGRKSYSLGIGFGPAILNDFGAVH